MINIKKLSPVFEIDVKEKIHTLKALHDNRLLAVAQKHNIYIYDDSGTEIHNVLSMKRVKSLTFLP